MRKIYLLFSVLIFTLVGCGGNKVSPSSSVSSSNDVSSSNSKNSSYSSSVISSTIASSSSKISSNSSSSTMISTSSLSSKNSTDISSTSSDKIDVEIFLDTPTLVIDEMTGVVTWDLVNGATHYNYIINDQEVLTTTTNQLTINDKSSVSIQAANENSVSRWSNAVTYYDTSDIIVETQKDITVYFHDSGISPITIKSGKTINRPQDPIKNNNVFDNWYKDPFYQEQFDFNQPLYESTVIYANYIQDDLIDNVFYWIKANPKMTSNIMSSFSSNSGWRFIPLKLNEKNKQYREFVATVTVSGATSSTPCYFLIMDGFDDNPGRTYWKNNNADFSITTDGTYNIYFSVETQYKVGANIVQAKYELANNTMNYSSNLLNKITLDTPFINVDSYNNIATWDNVIGTNEYEVIIDNGMSQIITSNYISLEKGSFITIRALSENGDMSNWSIPKANINFIETEKDDTIAYVYFWGVDEPSMKLEKNTTIDSVLTPEKDGYTFSGWYLDIALTEKATFPYLVEENTIFYPKWENNDDYATKEYYKLVDSGGNKISGLTWNMDNYDFYEYNTDSITLTSGVQYYVKTLDNSKTWGPYSVNSTGAYVIYFSEDNVWNVGTTNESHVYIAKQTINVYFSNSYSWSGTIYAYPFDKSSGNYMNPWPGSPMSYVKTNSMGQKIYTIEVDVTLYDYIIFSNGDNQTVDISLAGAYNGIGYYVSGGSGKSHTVGTYTFS